MAAARSSVARTFQAAIQRWPKDPLRPECQLQDVLAKRLEKGTIAPGKKGSLTQTQVEIKQTNAIYSLLEDRYKNKYRVSDSLFEPKFNSTYYKDLLKELDEAPHRTFLQRMAKRIQGMFRLG